MARIKDISIDGTLTGDEKLVSTDADLSTKNIKVDTLKQYILTGQGTALTFPSTTGSAGQILISQGSSVLDWGDGFTGLTTTGTSGVATLVAGTLNIPNYGTLNSGQIFVGNASNVSTGVAMSGDVTIDNAGVTTVGTINSVAVATVTAGAALGATANQDTTSVILNGNLTGTVNGVAVATVTNGAAAGAVALPLAGGAMSGTIAGNQDIIGKRPTIVDTNATLTLQDNVHEGAFLYSNAATATTITIDPFSSEPFANGTEIKIMRGTAPPSVTVAPGSGVTLNGGASGIGIAAAYETITLKQLQQNDWVAYL